MKHVRLLRFGWVPVLVGVLIVGHGMVLYRLAFHMAWTVVLGLALLAKLLMILGSQRIISAR
jgi:hypothetical protein